MPLGAFVPELPHSPELGLSSYHVLMEINKLCQIANGVVGEVPATLGLNHIEQLSCSLSSPFFGLF